MVLKWYNLVFSIKARAERYSLQTCFPVNRAARQL